MTKLFRWLFGGTVLLVGLILIVIIAAYVFAIRSIPDYNADRQVTGLNSEVEIVRDVHGVPHIFGTTSRDAYFALGYVHAQDRLWQLILMRRTAQGRLSELFGARTLDTDRLIRQLGIYEQSRQSFAFQTVEAKAALEAYADGINAWLGIVNQEARGRGAPEFFLFNAKIAPWTPADSLAIVRLMALRLNVQLRDEVTRALFSHRLRPERLADILPESPAAAITALPVFALPVPGSAGTDARVVPPGGGDSWDSGWNSAVMAGRHRFDVTDNEDLSGFTFEAQDSRAPMPESPFRWPNPVLPDGLQGASNAWAARPHRSATGATLFASDPHLGLSAPGIWMLARMDFAETAVIGATIPGIPAILIGRNREIAWGITSAYVDDLDIYIERLNPENPYEYLTENGYRPFQRKPVVVAVHGGETHSLELLWTERGPVVDGHLFGLDVITPESHVASVRWTALDIDDRSMSSAIALMTARTIDAAREAGRLFKAPSLNLIIADPESIALQTVGAVPWRNIGHVGEGRVPALGWHERNQWKGYLPYDGLPYIRDPESGIVANTNNKTTDARFPFHISYKWGDTQRIERLERLLNEREVHTRESFVDAQLDMISFSARSLLPLVGRDLWYAESAATQGSPERLRREALDRLARWNGEMDSNLPEPLIYAAWIRNLQIRLAEDELGDLIHRISRPSPVFIERVFRDVDNASEWCDIRQTSTVETCVEIARRALDEALVELSETYGGQIESWRWGRAHRAHQDHEVLGEIPVLSWMANIRQETSGGDNTLRRGGMTWKDPNPYVSVHAAGFRTVVDFADPDNSLYIISTGQSGHMLSRHYDDLAQLWRRGEYITMSLDEAFVRSGAVGITRLRPR